MEELLYEGLEKEKSEIAFYLLKKSIKEKKVFEFEVISNSMSPLLKAGDKVSIRSISPGVLKKGDIIVYRINNHLYVHRYIYKTETKDNSCKLITKADNLPNFDQWKVPLEELFGKVISIKKDCGEINLESLFWRMHNYLLSWASYLQVSIIKFCYRIKKYLLGNKNYIFTSWIRKSILSSLSYALKSMVFIFILSWHFFFSQNRKNAVK